MDFRIKKLMEWFNFKNKDSQTTYTSSVPEDEVQDFQDTQNFGLKNHLEYLTTYFSFLISDYGFQVKTRRYFSREFWTTYTNLTIDIKIMYESGSELPWVYIEKCDKHDKYLIVPEFSDKLKLIITNKKQRIEPMMTRFLNNNYDYSELEKDYLEIGQFEHRDYMAEAALTIKDILENKTYEINAL
ncbi:MAG: hypothetical protein B7Z16_19190 [Algoriphagus sp. 32-45-6]|jgi:hypothetical protein|nr:hypothetical protein [Bacteroidia bacterium]OYX08297.1 MAG: hypothetical protein B7Z16_19190 [Algoriphagus sp. 32-45-6]